MKPTNIWTNHPNPQFKPMCKNNAPCHTVKWQDIQAHGMYSRPIMRGIMPDELIAHIVGICEGVE